MKQLLQNLKTGEAQVTEVPVPHPGEGTALVQTAASLVSAGTERMIVSFARQGLLGKAQSRPDLMRQVVNKAQREGLLTTLEAALNKLDQPMALGYSSAGTIVGVGPDLEGFRVGDRVACAGGGHAVHAEFATLPTEPDGTHPRRRRLQQAAFATVGAIALQGFRLADVQVVPSRGHRPGLLGLLATGIAAAAGCEVLGIDLDPDRVCLAGAMGAQTAVQRKQAVEAASVSPAAAGWMPS